MTLAPAHSISWGEVDQLLDLLARRVQTDAIDAIVGIARAGLVPAVCLSHRLGVRDLAVLEIRRTATDAVGSPKVPPVVRGLHAEAVVRGRRVLLVDDIVGEGATLDAARAFLRARCGAVTACALVVNQENLGARSPHDVVEHFACVVHGWVRFPWEGDRCPRGANGAPGGEDGEWSCDRR